MKKNTLKHTKLSNCRIIHKFASFYPFGPRVLSICIEDRKKSKRRNVTFLCVARIFGHHVLSICIEDRQTSKRRNATFLCIARVLKMFLLFQNKMKSE